MKYELRAYGLPCIRDIYKHNVVVSVHDKAGSPWKSKSECPYLIMIFALYTNHQTCACGHVNHLKLENCRVIPISRIKAGCVIDSAPTHFIKRTFVDQHLILNTAPIRATQQNLSTQNLIIYIHT